MTDRETLHISVRYLVEFLLRSGSIDNRIPAASSREAMELGSRMHRKLQKSADASYRAEIPLKIIFPYDDFNVQVEGRADGIFLSDGVPCIDEIKGVFTSLRYLEEPYAVHLAQALCYAYIYSKEEKIDTLGVRMTYVNLDTEEIKRFRFDYTADKLEKWFGDLMQKYERWASFHYEWKKCRNLSAGSIEFPYEYRDGQKKVVTGVYRTILRGKKLFIQAPTGVGKTIAAVFPTVKAVGEGICERIFYLTAKTITRTAAEKAFSVMRENGLSFKTITLTAKEKICPQEETECNPKDCPYANGHYDRVNDAVFDLLTSGDFFSRELILKYAEKHSVCPFEMSLDLSEWTDGVICDYNYLFDPNAHLRRFFSEGIREKNVFLIDEAHNLVERGRDMYSAVLRKEDFLEIRRLIGDRNHQLTNRITRCNETLLSWKRECEDTMVLPEIGSFALRLMNLSAEIEEFLEKLEPGEMRKKLLEFYLKIRSFLGIYDVYDENYVIYTEINETGFYIHLFCVNPASNLKKYMEKGIAAVLFSATLLPIAYYKKLLGADGGDYAVYAESPFDSANRYVVIGCDVTSRYKKRGEGMYREYAEYINAAVKAHSGNYMVFFPSYKLLDEVLEAYRQLSDDTAVLRIQRPNMTEKEREEFLACFEAEQSVDRSLIGFCIMGGIFAEGIDLPEERLIGAVLVGTGLPQICTERELLKEYFDSHGENGFEYAYLYSGITRVLQAAGRVIRTDKDKGVVLLLDDRFSRDEYQKLFPREWNRITACRRNELPGKLKEFWDTPYSS